ncbi:NucA/NucB deoxyribonuclease domain-containing protein [Burkholderia sp. BCC0405]|uniref:NucA/NucB deoxyribonuclease domain-containing protein n=1 Tax=Burkholderia sp. BCC0405 TaxID=2676298 RepID=UPI001ABA5C4F|nr:NucA/NucB deoxyribonuclease domain-containing protein [Burkholderia sp. BCC0405]
MAPFETAQNAGKPSALAIDRVGAAANRRNSPRGTNRVPGRDRDEYPPAMFKEEGVGASVRPISPADNRGAGSCIGAQCRGLPNGTQVNIRITDWQMGKFLEKLVDIGSASLSLTLPREELGMIGAVSKDLLALLERKNGFYAFESALHVLPSHSIGDEIGVVEWNAPDLWVGAYQDLAEGAVFFAEDIFGGQFCIRADGVYSFDPETANFEHLAHDLEGWAKLILEDCEYITGYPLAHEWQKSEGMLTLGARLVPKIPFVTGGNFSVDNLYAANAVEAMRIRANLAIQIKGLPDGEKNTVEN